MKTKAKVLLHVSGEVGTKRKNRIFFERKLAENIRKKIEAKIKRSYGSFLLEINKEDKEKLKKIPGIAWIAEVREIMPEEIKPKEKDETLKKILQEVFELIKDKGLDECDVEVRRAWKGFEKTSQQIREEIIKELKEKNLFKPKSKNKIFVEINKDWIVVYGEREKGVSGLPTGTSGKAVCLLSGGIDSAVAGFLAMKKGLEVIFVHFHNYHSNDYSLIDQKIVEIVKVLNQYQLTSLLYIIPLAEAQKEIIKHIDAKYRYLIYKYFMLKIAEKIAKQNKAEAIVTGDSLGQVASQTLTNISTLLSHIKIPVLMPLISYSKEEIIDIANKIGTYSLSIIPYSDCCSFMIARHPATKINKENFEKLIKKKKIKKFKKILRDTMKNIRKVVVKNGGSR